MAKVTVEVDFETTANQKFLSHMGKDITLDGQGHGEFEAEKGEFDLILFGIQGTPGTEATITLSVGSPNSIQISGHPIKGKIARGKTVWGGSRFFRVP